MKKKDIIQLVKKAIKEVDQFGNRQGPSNFQTSAVTSAGKDPYTGKNEYPFSKRPKRTATGMMEGRIDQSKVFDQSEVDRIIGEVREITGILEDTYNKDVEYKEFRFDDGTGGFQFQWDHGGAKWGGRFGLSLNEDGARKLSALSYYDNSSFGSENIRSNELANSSIETWKDLDTSMLVEIWSQLKPMVIKNEAGARKALSREAKAQADYYRGKADTGRIGYGLSSQPRMRNESVNEMESDSNYPDFDLNKNIRYQDTSISSGMWRYTGQEQGGKGVYRNLNNGQILGFDRSDFDIFRNNLSSHFDILESLNEISNKNAEKYSQPLNKLKNPKKIRNIAAGRNKFDDMLVWLSHNAKNLDYHLDGQGQLWVNGEDYETVRTELRESVNEMLDFEKKPGDKIKPDNFKNNPKLQPGKKVLYGGISYEVEENDGFILKLKSVESGKTTTVNLNQFISRGAIKEKNMKNNVKGESIDREFLSTSTTSQHPNPSSLSAEEIEAYINANKKTLFGRSLRTFQMVLNNKKEELEEADTKTFVGVDSMASIKKDPRYGTLSGDTKMDIDKKLKTGGSVELEEEPNEISYKDAKEKGLKSPDKADISKDKDISDYELKRGMAVQKAIDGQEKNEMYTNDIGKDDYTDDEGRMAKSQMYKTGKYAMKLHDMLDDMEQLPAWVQAKLTKASDYLSGVYHYLDYEFVRRDSNLMEHVNKHKKRDMLMEGAMKKFFEMFDKGKTDEEIVQDYARRGTTVPEPFVSKARRQYEGMKKMKLELEMSEKEFRNSSEKMVNNAEEGMESPMEEKQLASRLK